jgi:hypothetical protein
VPHFPLLTTKTDPFSEMLCFFLNILNSGCWITSSNPVSLIVIRHRRNHLDSARLVNVKYSTLQFIIALIFFSVIIIQHEAETKPLNSAVYIVILW